MEKKVPYVEEAVGMSETFNIADYSKKVISEVTKLKSDVEKLYNGYEIDEEFEDIDSILYQSFHENNYNEQEQLLSIKNLRSLMGLNNMKDAKFIEKKKVDDKKKKKNKRKLAKKNKNKNRKK